LQNLTDTTATSAVSGSPPRRGCPAGSTGPWDSAAEKSPLPSQPPPKILNSVPPFPRLPFFCGRHLHPRALSYGTAVIALSFYAVVIARCAKRAVAIHLDCFVASLLAMTVYFHRAIGITPCGANAPKLASAWTGCRSLLAAIRNARHRTNRRIACKRAPTKTRRSRDREGSIKCPGACSGDLYFAAATVAFS
jgi:hypothetical protein